MAARERSNKCKYGKACTNRGCERDHTCDFFVGRQGCNHSDAECKFEHVPKPCRNGADCPQRDSGCRFAHECFRFLRHGVCSDRDSCRLDHREEHNVVEPVSPRWAPPPYEAIARLNLGGPAARRDDSAHASPAGGAARRGPSGYDEELKAMEDAFCASPAAALPIGSLAAESPSLLPDFDPMEKDLAKRVAVAEKVGKTLRSQLEQVALEKSKAQVVALCFVLDCTGSMASCINAARDQIESIVRTIEAKDCRIEHVAFVGYRDWSDKELQYDILPFTSSLATFRTKLAAVRATGGGDEPEDVLGGLAKAAKLNWPSSSGTRVLFHLGDAPPHGSRFYPTGHDDYPSGHPSDMPVQQLFDLLSSKNIEYYFGEFNGSTDKMKHIFAEACGRPVDEVVASAANLAALQEIVTSSVLRAVAASVSRSSSSSRPGKTSAPVRLVRTPPDWATLPEIEAFHVTLQTMPIEQVREGHALSVQRRKTSLKVAPKPFASGAVRLAFFGKNIFRSGGSHDEDASFAEYDVVYKQFLTASAHQDPRMDVARYLTDLECQMVASQLAFNFGEALRKRRVPRNYNLRYLKLKMVHFKDPSTGRPRHMLEEKLFRHGMQLVKYTSNSRFVVHTPPAGTMDWDNKLEFLLAFSHFTYEHSQRYLLVTDLQGVILDDRDSKAVEEEVAPDDGEDDGKRNKRRLVLLTDPAIHCARHPRFGPTNLGAGGVRDFVEMHRGKCNAICKGLGLPEL